MSLLPRIKNIKQDVEAQQMFENIGWIMITHQKNLI